MCFLLVVAGLASCFMWVPCYHIIDDRVKEAVEMAQAGQGVGTRIFDKSDCANPCRGCFKIIVLAVMTPCECRVYADGSENGRPLQGCALVHLLEFVGCVRTRAAVVRCRSCGHVYYPVNGKVRHAVLHSVVEQLLLCEHARSHQSCLHRIWTMPCRHRRVHWGGGWVPVQVPVPAAGAVYRRHTEVHREVHFAADCQLHPSHLQVRRVLQWMPCYPSSNSVVTLDPAVWCACARCFRYIGRCCVFTWKHVLAPIGRWVCLASKR